MTSILLFILACVCTWTGVDTLMGDEGNKGFILCLIAIVAWLILLL